MSILLLLCAKFKFSLLIQVKGVYKSYGKGTKALVDVSLEVNEGDIVYILGESGSGKSTLMRVIAGLEDADKGSVTVNKQVITGPSQNLVPGYGSIAYLPQDYKLQQFLTVRDNIARKISFYSPQDRTARVNELLKVFKLEDKAESFPLTLSGGQQQRIAMAVALADEPEVMLLDEPFSNLDLPMKAEIRHEVIAMLHKIDVTVMIVSHDPVDALAVADQIGIFQNGTLVQKGIPSDLYHQPSTKYTASFLGPINEVVSKNATSLIRPEKLSFSATGSNKGKVTKCLFFGIHYHIYVSQENQDAPLLIYSSEKIGIGKTVCFSISTD